MPRKKVERLRTEFNIEFVRSSKFNTKNDSVQDKAAYPNFGYRDEDQKLRLMTMNKVTSNGLNLQCVNSGFCSARLKIDDAADHIIISCLSKEGWRKYKLKDLKLEDFNFMAVGVLYHRCDVSCIKKGCTRFKHHSNCKPVSENKAFQMEVRTAEQNPDMSVRQVIDYVEIKHNLSFCLKKGISSGREQWAAQQVKKKK